MRGAGGMSAESGGGAAMRADLALEPAAPRVSVIMRAKNCDWVIGQALAALYAQTFTDFELVLIDSGSTDRTLELAAAYPHRLIRIAPTDYVPGPVLNMGARAARGEILVFLNSDGVPLTPETLGRLVAAFDDPTVSAAVARQTPRPEADSWVRREYAASFPDAPRCAPWIGISAVMSAVRREAWEAHPFYDEAWGSEDTEWGEWAKRTGRVIRYVPEALVMHSHNYTLSQLYGRRFIEGEADAFIYARSEPFWKAFLRWGAWMARDAVHCLRAGDLADLPRLPARLAVYHYGYWKGHSHGTRRRMRGDRDIRLGQKTVLSRHESNRAASSDAPPEASVPAAACHATTPLPHTGGVS